MLSACGISEYWSSACWSNDTATSDTYNAKEKNKQNSLAITGDLKQKATDFVVVEVDLQMQYTNAENYQFFHHEPEKERKTKKNLQQENEALVDDDVEEADENTEQCSNPLADTTTSVLSRKEDILSFFASHKKVILDQLGTVEEVSAKCDALAQQQNNTHTGVNSITALLEHLAKGGFADTAEADDGNDKAERSWWEAEYTLGVIQLNKTEKKLLHYLVALSFPHLRSRVRPYRGDGGASSVKRDGAPLLQEFFVVVSPQFIFFHYLFDGGVPTTASSVKKKSPISLTLARWQQWDQYLQLHAAFSSGSNGGGDGCEEVLEAIDAELFQNRDQKEQQAEEKPTVPTTTEVPTVETVAPVEAELNQPTAVHTFSDAALEDAIAAFLPASNTKKQAPPPAVAPAAPLPPTPQDVPSERKIASEGTDTGTLFSPGNTKNGEVLYTAFNNHNSGGEADMSDKALRRHFHDLLRRCYPYVRCQVKHQVVSLQLAHAKGNHLTCGKRSREDGSHPKEETQHGKQGAEKQYVYYIVQKVNLDTAEMRQLLGHHFDVPEGQICVAGMKDKRGMTWQRCSVPATSKGSSLPIVLRWPSDPQNSYLLLHKSSLQEAAILYPAPIQLGQLRGNYFKITVRHLRREHAQKEEENHASLPLTTELLKETLTRRFEWIRAHGFINYFGQQRFSESITTLQDHTGLLLLQGRYVAAVKSLYRSCPSLYEEQFPEEMDPRHVPANARDAQAITHALKLAHRLYFQDEKRMLHKNKKKKNKVEAGEEKAEDEDSCGGGALTREEIQRESPRWQQICERAIADGVPYALRSIWIHAAQSLYFNVMASFLAARLQSEKFLQEQEEEALRELQLPLGGYRMELQPSTDGATAARSPRLQALVEEANTHALETLGLTSAALYDQRRVAGVPLSGGWRHFLVRPADTELACLATTSTTSSQEPEEVQAELSFFLPSSSYATVLLREVFGNHTWW